MTTSLDFFRNSKSAIGNSNCFIYFILHERECRLDSERMLKCYYFLFFLIILCRFTYFNYLNKLFEFNVRLLLKNNFNNREIASKPKYENWIK